MGKYYKGIAVLCSLFLYASILYAVSPAILQGMSDAEMDQELGATSVVGTNGPGWWDTCVLQAATSGKMTAEYAYIYATTTTGSNHFRVGVYENNAGAIGAQVGGCSDEGTLTTGAAAWNQTTWSSNHPVLQPATVYFICYWGDAAASLYYEYNDVGTDHWDNGTGTCNDIPVNADGTTYANLTVSNYAAH